MSRATEILKQVSAHKDAVNKLSERIAETHDRMIQVIDNARSVASGTTSQLFD
jgi:DNA-binding FrmR family transcriptional regulator